MPNHTIGILTSQKDTPFFRHLLQEGQTLGANVFLFSPQDVSIEERRIDGYVSNEKHGLRKDRFTWPEIVIDYYRYYPLPRHEGYLSFRKQNLFVYANSRFSNKWAVHQVFCKDEEMNKWLPESVAFSHDNLRDMLRRHRLVYMKPTNGTGGRSILRIERVNQGYKLHGRNKYQVKTCFYVSTLANLQQWVNRWVTHQRYGTESFFLQQGLQLELVPDRTVDIRLLIQKNEKGNWKITGKGVRIGQPDSSTSNLHGGGKAARLTRFLTKRFGEEKAKIIKQQCRELAYLSVTKIEEHYGRMMEFGLDIGVDVNGRVWLIEMNPKPGRDIFRKLGREDRYALAVRRPLQYALHLLNQQNQSGLPSKDDEQNMQSDQNAEHEQKAPNA